MTWVNSDILAWQPLRHYDFLHDRAVFHFLVDPDDRSRYRELLSLALNPGAGVVIGTFAVDGPTHCSGLEVMRYSPEELLAELGSEFHLVSEKLEDHRSPSGQLQHFSWLALRYLPL